MGMRRSLRDLFLASLLQKHFVAVGVGNRLKNAPFSMHCDWRHDGKECDFLPSLK